MTKAIKKGLFIFLTAAILVFTAAVQLAAAANLKEIKTYTTENHFMPCKAVAVCRPFQTAK